MFVKAEKIAIVGERGLAPLQLSVTKSLPRPGKDCRIGWKGELAKGNTIRELPQRHVSTYTDW